MNAKSHNQSTPASKGGFLAGFKHAFAVEPAGTPQPTDRQREVVEQLCAGIVRRGLTVPALAFLEMARPMNYVGAQTLHFFAPVLSAVTDADGHRQLATFLEHRGSIDYICRTIEQIESRRGKDADASPSEGAPPRPRDDDSHATGGTDRDQ